MRDRNPVWTVPSPPAGGEWISDIRSVGYPAVSPNGDMSGFVDCTSAKQTLAE
jgi:hypothetical protein